MKLNKKTYLSILLGITLILHLIVIFIHEGDLSRMTFAYLVFLYEFPLVIGGLIAICLYLNKLSKTKEKEIYAILGYLVVFIPWFLFLGFVAQMTGLIKS